MDPKNTRPVEPNPGNRHGCLPPKRPGHAANQRSTRCGSGAYTGSMFLEKSQAFLSLPLKDAASLDLARQIGELLRGHDIEPVLATDADTQAPLSDQIQAAIRRAEFVVADLTDANPNVLFEVGLAQGLSKPVLLLSQGRASAVPSDLRAQQVAMYRPDDPSTVLRYVELWLRDIRKSRQSAEF